MISRSISFSLFIRLKTTCKKISFFPTIIAYITKSAKSYRFKALTIKVCHESVIFFKRIRTKEQQLMMVREYSDNFLSKCLICAYALCNAYQFMNSSNSGQANAKRHIDRVNSKIVFGALENQVFKVKQAKKCGKPFFGVNMATAATHIDDEFLINAICDTGRAYKLPSNVFSGNFGTVFELNITSNKQCHE